MNWKEQILKWLEDPTIEEIKITEWKTFADSDNEFTSFSHLPILTIKKRTVTQIGDKFTVKELGIIESCLNRNLEEARKRRIDDVYNNHQDLLRKVQELSKLKQQM